MGALLPKYKKAIIDDVISSISTNTAYYYGFASNPVSLTGGVPNVTVDNYSSIFTNDWQMLFGKKLSSSDIMHVIKNNPWVSGSVYDMYDNTDPNLYNKNYYVIAPPSIVGSPRNVYICLDNNNGAPSTSIPDIVQQTSFQKSDGYIWRYVATISDQIYKKFSTVSYAPVYANNILVSGAALYSGVDVVVIANSGSDYRTYANGIIQSNPTPNVIQIESTNLPISNFFVNCGIYIYTTGYSTADLKTVTQYNVNTSGNWIHLDSNANTNNIIPGVTQYILSPRVVFDTDGITQPKAYSTINATTNSISSIVITDTGTNISRANVSILPGLYGSGANLYAIAPPPGGYGSDPVSQLNVQGFGVSFSFANNENNTIPTEIHYNKIGLLKNPYKANTSGGKSVSLWTNTSFNQVLVANIYPSVTYNVGDTVVGNTSGAKGTVAFSNSTLVYLTGDKYFANGEYIKSTIGTTTQITINTSAGTYGNVNIYAKDIEPIYVQNLDDVQRSNSQTETYKLVIQI